MDNIRFDIIRLTPEQTRKNVRPGAFPEGNQLALSDDRYGDEVIVSFERSAEGSIQFPGVVGGPLPFYLSYSIVRGRKLTESGTSLFFSVSRNEMLQREADNHCQFEVKWRKPWTGPWTKNVPTNNLWSSDRIPLKSGVIMTSASLGDYNGDGRTDLLARLSDGGAIVFQQTGEDVPPTQCQLRSSGGPR